MNFHHIGIATNNIANSVFLYTQLGYSAGEIIFDSFQRVNLCFLKKENDPLIELVSPFDESSPVNQILKKNGTIPYHTCYEVDSINDSIKHLKSNKFILISKPVQAIAFNNRLVCFLYNSSFGILELLEKN